MTMMLWWWCWWSKQMPFAGDQVGGGEGGAGCPRQEGQEQAEGDQSQPVRLFRPEDQGF